MEKLMTIRAYIAAELANVEKIIFSLKIEKFIKKRPKLWEVEKYRRAARLVVLTIP